MTEALQVSPSCLLKNQRSSSQEEPAGTCTLGSSHSCSSSRRRSANKEYHQEPPQVTQAERGAWLSPWLGLPPEKKPPSRAEQSSRSKADGHREEPDDSADLRLLHFTAL